MTATVIGGLLGGVLTVIGGLLGTIFLSRLEQDREVKRQLARHATAVRIVFLELQSNCASLIGLARGVKTHPMSTAAYLNVGLDLYALLPADIAKDVSFAYTIATFEEIEPEAVEDLLVRMMAILSEVSDYGRKTLGLELPLIGKASASEWFRGSTRANQK